MPYRIIDLFKDISSDVIDHLNSESRHTKFYNWIFRGNAFNSKKIYVCSAIYRNDKKDIENLY